MAEERNEYPSFPYYCIPAGIGAAPVTSDVTQKNLSAFGMKRMLIK